MCNIDADSFENTKKSIMMVYVMINSKAFLPSNSSKLFVKIQSMSFLNSTQSPIVFQENQKVAGINLKELKQTLGKPELNKC